MTDVAEQVAEQTAEVVEEAIDGVVEVVEVVRNNPALLVGVGVLGLLAGFGGGYIFAKKRLGADFDERLITEVEEAKSFYRGMNKVNDDGTEMTPEQVLEERHPEAATALRQYRGEGAEKAEEELLERATMRAADPEKVEEGARIYQERVFERRGQAPEKEEYIYEVEVELRKEDEPYIITHDEFFENQPDDATAVYTYYEGDDVLADEADKAIHESEIEKLVGQDHLVKFGWGSKDANIVYVRNERLGMVFEIVRSSGSYSKEVLNFDDAEPLKHSQRRGQSRRDRWDDS